MAPGETGRPYTVLGGRGVGAVRQAARQPVLPPITRLPWGDESSLELMHTGTSTAFSSSMTSAIFAGRILQA